MPEVYRKAASILVFRKGAKGDWEILLLHKPRKNDSWQLPQGGVEEGEDVREAALRELQEEASLKDCTVIGESAHAYQYDFPDSYRRFRPDNVKGQRIGFIFAVAPEGATVQVDNKEVDDFRWIPPFQIAMHIRRREYLELVEKMIAEARELLPR
jgi:8-oxo-dGTP pyrophosphatase MutT (NUDIX family)